MDTLEKYYKERVFTEGLMPAFSTLSADEKAVLEKSIGFAFFQTSLEFSRLNYALRGFSFKKRRPIIRRLR